jgi:hypothetical protein
MILLNHPDLKSQKVVFVDSSTDVLTTPTGSLLVYTFDRTMIENYQQMITGGLPLAIEVASIVELLLVASFSPRFCIVPTFLAKEAQRLATNYLWDTKVIVAITREQEIVWASLLELDGVLFKK